MTIRSCIPVFAVSFFAEETKRVTEERGGKRKHTQKVEEKQNVRCWWQSCLQFGEEEGGGES